MDIVLSDMEVRILGSLIEKKMVTPDYYPLSLNALTNACNQKSNRDPVVSYDEMSIGTVLDDLEEKGLVSKSTIGRVPKYEETLTQEKNLVGHESSILCILFLRGPQTPGMIRGRTTRLHNFESLDELHATINNLEDFGYIKKLSRLPGHKESRYTHLFSGEPEVEEQRSLLTTDVDTPEDNERLEKMEQDIGSLRHGLEELKEAFQVFKKQFE